MQSIGSLSEHVLSYNEQNKRRSGMKLSDQLLEERMLLFGPTGGKKKRVLKRMLPKTKKNKWDMIVLGSPEECEGIFKMILSKFRSVYKEEIFLEHIRNPRSSRERHVRMMVCYITTQCFFIRQKEVTGYFGMCRDIIGTANRMLGAMFESHPEERQKFFDFLDYFVTLTKREYV